MVLHLLAHTLNQLGERASVWRMPDIRHMSDIETNARSIRQRLRRLIRRTPFQTSPDLDTPVFTGRRAPPDAVVVYPEVTLGNPLRAAHVVRWLLFKPGVHFPYHFTENEMFFRWGSMFDMPELTGGAPDLFIWHRNRVYVNENRHDRKGISYIVRKGYDKPRLPETEDPAAICIDGMSHAEVNEVFNKTKTFISYDEATTFSQFAAICGCDSIIVPGFYTSHEDWVANHPLGVYGVAYGFENLEHAQATQHMVIELLNQRERDGVEMVKDFIRRTKERFEADPAPARVQSRPA